MKKEYWLYTLVAVCLFVISGGVAYLLVNKTAKAPVVTTPTTSTSATGIHASIDPKVPKTEVCPLNGLKYTAQEKAVWDKRRPLAVMIENHVDARPESGLGDADIVYEAVAEGGITRFMGIFYCGVAAGDEMFAPVRSARIYFVKLVAEYDALYNHVGGAGRCDDPTVDPRAKALCFISQNKIKDLDQFGPAGDFKTCHRVTNRTGKEVAYEHTMACFSNELYAVAEKLGWTNVDAKNVSWTKNFVSWKFKDDTGSQGTTADIKFGFWKNQPDYDVEWKYDAPSNSYKRFNGGAIAVDQNTNVQLAAKDVVIEFAKETGPLDEHQHMYYEDVGTGKMILFQDGKNVTGSWSKASPFARTKFMDDAGKEVQFTPGQIWVEIVPSGNQIEYN